MPAILMTGCGPGSLDYVEEIGDTGLVEVRTDSHSHFIIRQTGEKSAELVVDSDVIAYRILDDKVIGLRQIINWYLCDGSRSEIEVTDQTQYFAIDTTDNAEQLRAIVFDEYFELQNYLGQAGQDHVVIEIGPALMAPHLNSVHDVHPSVKSTCKLIST